MNLQLNLSLGEKYRSNSQMVRVFTENWVKENSFCPNCNNQILSQFENNSPVADFYCTQCEQEYELKSRNGQMSAKIIDGAYHTMIKRIKAENNPNFFFLSYSKSNWKVNDFLIVPKHYFVPTLIEIRKPLSSSARRAGWTGCNILLDKIPTSGRIFIVKDSIVINRDVVIKKWKQTEFMKNVSQKSKGWLIDILHCIDLLPNETFTLKDIYKFEDILRNKHPKNKNIKAKIRQQLQLVRDKGLIDFEARGLYKKKDQVV